MAPSAKRKAHSSAALPTGTVTFLFTDIEGSTQRWDHHREAMKAAVARHDSLMRAAMETHGGHVFKTVGDAYCVAFRRPEEAIASALDVQRKLNAEDFSTVNGLKVRMALHTGTTDERDGDYFGPAVNRVARLMAIGHGGQVLVSDATRGLTYADLPSGVSLVDLGSQRLKDLTDPEQVWQLNIAGLPAEFPPLRSLDALPNNLPIQRTTFVGREHDVAEVKELLTHNHLITLVGSGGVGKTRLALQVGADLLDRYPDGVWFVDLAPITDPELVSSVTAQVLGMSQQEGKRVDESIPPWLKRKKLLLIFDNCEHVLEAAAALVSAILHTANDVRILATSRQALNISGEVLHRIPSLSVPSDAEDLQAEQMLQYGALELFVDRAKAVDTHFVITDHNAPIIADICCRLDGIPLAIELAAARVKVLSIPNLSQRLNERFKILTGGSRDVLPRQKTLTALIDWSYELLTSQEQRLFRRLGIFAGGFGLDAVSSVCGGEGLDEVDVVDLLMSLTDKSLVIADTSGEQERYHLLESTRAYALEKLSASVERESLARRHAQYFRDQAQAADESLGKGSTFEWLAQVELELDNYRAALEWALTQGNDAVLGGAIAAALRGMWYRGGLTAEGRYWIIAALERVSESEHPRIVARLLFVLSRLSSAKRAYEAAERSLRLFEASGEANQAARARCRLSYALYQMGRLEEAGYEIARATKESRKCGDRVAVADNLNWQGAMEEIRGDPGAGRDLYAQAIEAYRMLGDEAAVALVQINLAELEFASGHPERALHFANDALETNLRAKLAPQIMGVQSNIAAYHIALCNFTQAQESARDALHWARKIGTDLPISVALQHLALISILRDDARRAARLLGYVDRQYEELGARREPTENWSYSKLMAALREKLSADEIEKLAAEGAAWSEDQAVEEALKV